MSFFSKAVSSVASFVFGEAAGKATSTYLSGDTFGGRLIGNLAEGFIGGGKDESKGYESYIPMQEQTKLSGVSRTDAGTYRSTKVDGGSIGDVPRVREKGRIAQQSTMPKIQAHVDYISPRTASGRRTQTLESSGLKIRK